MAKAQKERPIGYLVKAPAADVKDLQQLAGHSDGELVHQLQLFADEMNDDLLIVPARYNGTEDTSEYGDLPSSPP